MNTRSKYEDLPTKSIREIYQTEIQMVKQNRFLDENEKKSKIKALQEQLKIEEER